MIELSKNISKLMVALPCQLCKRATCAADTGIQCRLVYCVLGFVATTSMVQTPLRSCGVYCVWQLGGSCFWHELKQPQLVTPKHLLMEHCLMLEAMVSHKVRFSCPFAAAAHQQCLLGTHGKL